MMSLLRALLLRAALCSAVTPARRGSAGGGARSGGAPSLAADTRGVISGALEAGWSRPQTDATVDQRVLASLDSDYHSPPEDVDLTGDWVTSSGLHVVIIGPSPLKGDADAKGSVLAIGQRNSAPSAGDDDESAVSAESDPQTDAGDDGPVEIGGDDGGEVDEEAVEEEVEEEQGDPQAEGSPVSDDKGTLHEDRFKALDARINTQAREGAGPGFVTMYATGPAAYRRKLRVMHGGKRVEMDVADDGMYWATLVQRGSLNWNDGDTWRRSVDCDFAAWSLWGPCGVRCPAGYQFRRREFDHLQENGGTACLGELEECRRATFCGAPKAPSPALHPTADKEAAEEVGSEDTSGDGHDSTASEDDEEVPGGGSNKAEVLVRKE